jgi:hypothetical protein
MIYALALLKSEAQDQELRAAAVVKTATGQVGQQDVVQPAVIALVQPVAPE